MNLTDLEALVCLAEEGSFSRVAEKLNRSQPGVSQSIRRLEELVQAQLVDRTSRRVVLTGAGSTVVAYAERILQLRDGVMRVGAEQNSGKGGVLRLAGNGYLCEYLLPPLLEAFRRIHPRARIEVVQCPATAIPSALLDQDLDFGFLSFAPAHRDLETQVLFRDDLALAVPPGHPLALSASVGIPQLARETFLAHSARTPSRKRLEYQFSQEGMQARVGMELPSIETIKRFVAAGSGIAILPRLCLERELAEGSLVCPGMKGMPIGRDIRVAYRRSRLPSNLAAGFLSLLNQRFTRKVA